MFFALRLVVVFLWLHLEVALAGKGGGPETTPRCCAPAEEFTFISPREDVTVACGEANYLRQCNASRVPNVTSSMWACRNWPIQWQKKKLFGTLTPTVLRVKKRSGETSFWR